MSNVKNLKTTGMQLLTAAKIKFAGKTSTHDRLLEDFNIACGEFLRGVKATLSQCETYSSTDHARSARATWSRLATVKRASVNFKAAPASPFSSAPVSQ